MKRADKKLLFFWKALSVIPAILLMLTIFQFSAQTGTESGSLSHTVSCSIVKTGNRLFQMDMEASEIADAAEKIEHPVRKAAHMTEYFLLALSVCLPLYVFGLRGIPMMAAAGMVCICFAAGDEYHQSFVAGRGPSAADVGIDSIGVAAGILVAGAVCVLRKELKKRGTDHAQNGDSGAGIEYRDRESRF